MSTNSLEEFIEYYNKIVIDGESVSHYQLAIVSTEEIIRVFANPADFADVRTTIDSAAADMPTGSHTIKLVAISTDKQPIGRWSQTLSGRSQAAKVSAQEQISHAKALSMNIDTADRQLVNMSARLEEANERARIAEDRAGGMIQEVYKMGDLVNKFIVEKESEHLDREEREARNAAILSIAGTIAPILQVLMTEGSNLLEMWIKNKKEDLANKKATSNGYSSNTKVNVNVKEN